MEDDKVEIKDPEGLLRAYEQAKKDIVSLRAENKALKTKVESVESGEEQDRWKARALKAETRLALADLGVKNVDRVAKFVNTEGLDFDDEGNIVGLSDKIEELKSDLPEIFDAKRRVGGMADIFADDSVRETKSLTEQQVDALFN